MSAGKDPSYTVSYYYQGEVLNRIGYPTNLNSFAINYTYDDMGMTLKVFNPTISSPPYYATFTYDKANELTSVSYGNGLTTNYNYDRLSRPSQVKTVNGATNLLVLSYGYKTGTVSSVVGSSTDSSSNSYSLNEHFHTFAARSRDRD